MIKTKEQLAKDYCEICKEERCINRFKPWNDCDCIQNYEWFIDKYKIEQLTKALTFFVDVTNHKYLIGVELARETLKSLEEL